MANKVLYRKMESGSGISWVLSVLRLCCLGRRLVAGRLLGISPGSQNQEEPKRQLPLGSPSVAWHPLFPAGSLSCPGLDRVMTQLGQGDPQELPSSHHTGSVEAVPAGGASPAFLKSS